MNPTSPPTQHGTGMIQPAGWGGPWLLGAWAVSCRRAAEQAFGVRSQPGFSLKPPSCHLARAPIVAQMNPICFAKQGSAPCYSHLTELFQNELKTLNFWNSFFFFFEALCKSAFNCLLVNSSITEIAKPKIKAGAALVAQQTCRNQLRTALHVAHNISFP